MALASHCTNVPEGSMWNLQGQGVTACTPSHPGAPQGLSHQPHRAPCTAGAGIHPQELLGWQLTRSDTALLPQRTVFLWISQLILMFF